MKDVVLMSIIFTLSASALAQPIGESERASLNRANKKAELNLKRTIQEREELIHRMCGDADLECPNFPEIPDDLESEIEICKIDEHVVALKSCYGTYIQVSPEGRVGTYPSVNGSWEKFITTRSGDFYIFFGCSGQPPLHRLTALSEEEGLLKGCGLSLGQWFFLEPVPGKENTFRIKTQNGERIVVNREGQVFTCPYPGDERGNFGPNAGYLKRYQEGFRGGISSCLRRE